MNRLDSYICDRCGEEFRKTLTDEAAIKEKDELFGDIPVDKCDLVCDDCFKDIMVKFN